ncbi:hypothetical protein [Paraliobacillus sp. JSM ZJ581]|uniref:hypothetical protein n=1 Tax=Paraliobacillus sp. JSM ZJ581 TaxID=3342118 RepID=UPI0035A844AD
MKRYKLFVIFTILVVIGCAQQLNPPEGFYSYDHSEVNALLNQLKFDPEMPTFLPMKVVFIVTDHFVLEGTKQEAIDVSFYSKENDVLTFQATEGTFEYPKNSEEVQINQHVKGNFTNNQFAKSLYWKKDHITYVITFRSNMDHKQVSEKVTKQDLIKVAEAI